MSDVTIPEALAEAAARGVEVTIITNERDAPELRFKWRYEEKWWGAIARYDAAGFTASVIDKDGDASEWSVKRGKTVIAEGGTYDCHPYYHFDACLIAAENALLEAARSRAQAIRSSHE